MVSFSHFRGMPITLVDHRAVALTVYRILLFLKYRNPKISFSTRYAAVSIVINIEICYKSAKSEIR